jgi:hypothetical protein
MHIDVFLEFKHPEPTTMWLTADEKCVLMKELECVEQNGQLDADSISPLQQLNALPGLASVFSCVGHPELSHTGGYLLLRASKKVAEVLDKSVIERLWEDELICGASKDWQCAYDATDRPIPRISYTLRFPTGFMDRVCEAIYQYVNKEL